MTIDARHDGRYRLTDRPLMRKSIPYCVAMPEERIALFTHTWIDKESVTAASFGLWGPA